MRFLTSYRNDTPYIIGLNSFGFTGKMSICQFKELAIYLQEILQIKFWYMKKKNQQRKKKKNIEEQNQKTEINKQQETEEQLEQNEEKLSREEELAQNLQEEKDKYVRLYAEFENYRKRTAKEKLALFDTAAENIIKNLLPVLDDFERAINEMKKNQDDEWGKGVELIYEKFYKTLEKEGLKLVDVKKTDDFDPEIHEAIAQVPVDDEKMKGKIVDVVEKGYQLGPKIIRFPKVVTGR